MQHGQTLDYAAQTGRATDPGIKQTSPSPSYLGQGVPDADTDEASEDDYDQSTAHRGGKRKRPVSVS